MSLTSTTSKTALPNILKIASNEHIRIVGRDQTKIKCRQQSGVSTYQLFLSSLRSITCENHLEDPVVVGSGEGRRGGGSWGTRGVMTLPNFADIEKRTRVEIYKLPYFL